jgi:hypothetical protein
MSLHCERSEVDRWWRWWPACKWFHLHMCVDKMAMERIRTSKLGKSKTQIVRKALRERGCSFVLSAAFVEGSTSWHSPSSYPLYRFGHAHVGSLAPFGPFGWVIQCTTLEISVGYHKLTNHRSPSLVLLQDALSPVKVIAQQIFQIALLLVWEQC